MWLLWSARGIWFPVSLAFIIAMVLDPTVDRLENRGMSRAMASTLVFVGFLAVAVAVVVLFGSVISSQAASIARDLARLFPDPSQPDLVPVTQRILTRLDANPALRDSLVEVARKATGHLTAYLEGASGLIVALVPNLAWVVVVPVLAFYTLNDFHRIYAKAVLLVPKHHRPFAQSVIAEVSTVFGKYVRGLGTVCLLLGLADSAILFALGSPYWLFLGLLGGLLYAIPVFGSLFTVGLVMLVSIVTAAPGKAMLMGGGIFLTHFAIFDQIVTPRVLGKQVGLHPILTILALLIGYQVWGLSGMLIAVPLAASIQVLVVHLVPKLANEMELRPLEELRRTEEETRQEHLKAEEQPLDAHLLLHTVIENAEAPPAEVTEESATPVLSVQSS